MERQTIVGVGPLSPPITGPGLKNKYIKQGLEDAGIRVSWVNTLERSSGTVLEFINRYKDGNRFLLSASTKVRLGTAPMLARKFSSDDVHGVLLPAGGSFARELRRLPPGIRGRYIEWFGRFDCILPQSEELSTELGELFAGRTYISALPNLRPVPDTPPKFESFAGEERPLRLVYVGRIKETKGLDHLMTAIEGINNSSERISLDVFGHFLQGDPYKQQFLQRCDTLSNVDFLGKIDNKKVIERLREYDVFAFPSYYPGEGFPGVLVEAFAAGCLVIASNWNYNSELVSHEHDGLLFEPKNAEDIRKKIEFLLDNPEKVTEFKKNSWSKAERYSIRTVTDELITHLERSGW